MSDDIKTEKIALSARESELVVLLMQCLKDEGIKPLQVDWEKFTKMAEYKNQNSARTSFGYVIKKLSEGTLEKHYVAQSSSGSANAVAPAKKRAPAKSKATDHVNDADADGAATTPTKKRAAKPKASATDDAPIANDATSDMTPKKKRASKGTSEAPARKRTKLSPATVKAEKDEETEMTIDGLEHAKEEEAAAAEEEDDSFFDAALEPAAATAAAVAAG